MVEGLEGYLLDLDGTLVTGGVALPGAAWLLDRLEGQFAIVSNNAEHTPGDLSRRLRRIGLPVGPEHIVLAGTAAVDRVARDCPGARVLLLGSRALHRYARKRGLRPATERCDVVLVGRDTRFSYRKLASAATAVSSGAELYVACPDGSHRGPDGQPVPEAGALAAAILACAGRDDYHVVGKPESLLFRLGCERLGVAPTKALMIGDNPATDGAGARRLGMRFLRVRPGDLGPALFLNMQETA
ncbi:HAD-IIA family hydrolase [Aurantimonas sp. A3-2-R12]|uniref:HAD-IIA family hydrolase n=1 Tax=Aurantimonas sp. A3-2-R12 TaxID=3114362 RepID=UPI002E192A3A|nr:HAD hydrolase-like protein [Aurantimonas sp. A3-2-R12]